MDEPPATALRGKKDSSMRVAIDLVKDGAAQACVSAGNTGALMAISRFVLKTLPGIDRPAIADELPTLRGHTYDARPGRQRRLHGRASVPVRHHGRGARRAPMDGKSTADASACSTSARRRSRATMSSSEPAELLRASALNFYGNVEGDDIYKGTTDVVVCDGFVGNVALKTSEGLAQMLGEYLREEFKRNFASRSWRALRRMPVDQRLQAPRRSSPLQRRDADRPARHRRQESRLGRRARFRVRAAARRTTRRARRARRIAQRSRDAPCSATAAQSEKRGMPIRDHRAPAAICRRRS